MWQHHVILGKKNPELYSLGAWQTFEGGGVIKKLKGGAQFWGKTVKSKCLLWHSPRGISEKQGVKLNWFHKQLPYRSIPCIFIQKLNGISFQINLHRTITAENFSNYCGQITSRYSQLIHLFLILFYLASSVTVYRWLFSSWYFSVWLHLPWFTDGFGDEAHEGHVSFLIDLLCIKQTFFWID